MMRTHPTATALDSGGVEARNRDGGACVVRMAPPEPLTVRSRNTLTVPGPWWNTTNSTTRPAVHPPRPHRRPAATGNNQLPGGTE